MNGQAIVNSECPQELRVLIFTVRGVRIGVDADQIAEMLDLEAARARGLAIRYFHENVSFGDMPVQYHAPKVIIIKGGRAPYGMVIDAPDDIAVVSTSSIRPLPALIRGRDASRAVWGAIVNKDEVVLLVDLYKCTDRGIPAAGPLGPHELKQPTEEP
jgi:hypothetical protein